MRTVGVGAKKPIDNSGELGLKKKNKELLAENKRLKEEIASLKLAIEQLEPAAKK